MNARTGLQEFMQGLVETVRDINCSMSVYLFVCNVCDP